MDIVKHPLNNLSADDLLNRLEEECSELIHAICKRRRFGAKTPSPRTGETADERVISEMHDVNAVLDEVYRRLGDGGSFAALTGYMSHEDWMGC